MKKTTFNPLEYAILNIQHTQWYKGVDFRANYTWTNDSDRAALMTKKDAFKMEDDNPFTLRAVRI